MRILVLLTALFASLAAFGEIHIIPAVPTIADPVTIRVESTFGSPGRLGGRAASRSLHLPNRGAHQRDRLLGPFHAEHDVPRRRRRSR